MTESLKERETEVDRWKDGETHWNKQAIGLHEEKKKKKKKKKMQGTTIKKNVLMVFNSDLVSIIWLTLFKIRAGRIYLVTFCNTKFQHNFASNTRIVACVQIGWQDDSNRPSSRMLTHLETCLEIRFRAPPGAGLNLPNFVVHLTFA